MIHYHSPKGSETKTLTAKELEKDSFYRIVQAPNSALVGKIAYRDNFVGLDGGRVSMMGYDWTIRLDWVSDPEYLFEEIPKDEKITFTTSYGDVE